jgi:hypothetical protein
MYSLLLEPFDETVGMKEMATVCDLHELGVGDGAEADDAVSVGGGLEVGR